MFHRTFGYDAQGIERLAATALPAEDGQRIAYQARADFRRSREN
jgi:hypothetical protein